MNEYDRVPPTDAETEDWRRRHPRQGPPYRVRCNACGRRFWLSGIGLGAHRRSTRHNDALRADRIARMNAMHTGSYRMGE